MLLQEEEVRTDIQMLIMRTQSGDAIYEPRRVASASVIQKEQLKIRSFAGTDYKHQHPEL